MTRRTSFVVWFTGLPCAGKTTLARKMADRLESLGVSVERLDGDALRSALPPIGFSKEARNAHIQSVGFWASRLEAHGVCVVASFVSPYREAREQVRAVCANFIEVYVEAPLAVCKERDVKGMYKKALAGELPGFTGVDDPYEAPDAPEVRVQTAAQTPDECIEAIFDCLTKLQLLEPAGSLWPQSAATGGSRR